MSNKTWLRKNWKLALNWLTLIALVVLVYAIRHQLADTIGNLKHVHAWALLLMLPIEALNYHAQTKLYQGLFGIVGNDLGYKALYGASLELNFVNHVFPSGGVTGISYFGLRMRSGDQITGGKATLIQVMKLALTFVSFEVLIIFGLISLTVMGRVNNVTVMVAASISTFLVFATALFIYIVGSKRRISHFFTSATNSLNWLISRLWRSNPQPINVSKAKQVFDDFHDNYQVIKDNLTNLKMPFWYALLANLTEVAVVYSVFVAFGHLVNIGAVILAYAVANFAGFVSVLPGGVGIYEALMTAVLASAGVRASISLPVIVTYRVINTIIQLPPGYVLYRKALATKDNKNDV